MELGLRHFALTQGARCALIDPQGRRTTFAELYALSNRFARALLENGLGPGDAIAIFAPNSVEFLISYCGAISAGVSVVPVNWHLALPEITHVLQDSGARALVVHERVRHVPLAALAKLASSAVLRVSIGEIAGFEEFHRFVSSFSDAPLEEGQLGRMMIYTSATTGMPKAVVSPLQDAAAAHERILKAHSWLQAKAGIYPGSESVHLCASMLYHASPLECAATAIHLGQCAVLMDRWDPQEALRLIERYQVESSMMVPAMFARLLKLPVSIRETHDTSSLKFVPHGCAPCAMDVKREMLRWWGPVLWEMYGASEGSGTMASPEEWLKFPGTVGRPIPGSAVKILSETGDELAPGEQGLIYLRRYTGDRFEYRNDPEKTRAAYRGDFFSAGDIGYVNEEGYLFICDRKVDMIISGGMNIYPAEIERVLVAHPLVADCAVFGVPDAVFGEVAKAVIEPVDPAGSGSELSADIMRYLAERMSTSKLPRYIEYIEKLPRDPNGKLFKRRLRAEFLAREDAAVSRAHQTGR
jgi:long-chain acyl-CoA synthetase